MSKLDELIRELCPDGVEYKTLGEIGKFYGGLTGKSKKDFENGNEVFITYKNVYSNPAIDIYPNDKVKIVVGEKQRTLEYGDIVLQVHRRRRTSAAFHRLLQESRIENYI